MQTQLRSDLATRFLVFFVVSVPMVVVSLELAPIVVEPDPLVAPVSALCVVLPVELPAVSVLGVVPLVAAAPLVLVPAAAGAVESVVPEVPAAGVLLEPAVPLVPLDVPVCDQARPNVPAKAAATTVMLNF